MASTYDKKFKTTETTKAADAEVVSDPIELGPRTKNHILTVTTDSSLSGTVDVEMEMSPDGTNWCPAVSRTVSGGASSSTGDVIGNEESVKLTPDVGEFKNKHARGGLNFDVSGNTVTPDGSGARDLMHQHISVNKSFNYSQWFKTSENPTTTYKPVLFRHGGYDNFTNAKTVQLTNSNTQNLVAAGIPTNENAIQIPDNNQNVPTAVIDTDASYNDSPFYVSTDSSPTQDFPDVGDGFGISFWIKWVSKGGGTSWLFNEVFKHTFTDGSYFTIRNTHRGDQSAGVRHLRVQYVAPNGSDYFLAEHNVNSYTDGNWYQFVVAVKGTGTNGQLTPTSSTSTNDMKLYVNGSEQTPVLGQSSTVPTFDSSSTKTIDTFKIGMKAGTLSATGDVYQLDDVAYYRGELNATTVASIYANRKNVTEATLPSGTVLTALWKMGDGTNDVISPVTSMSIRNQIATNDIRLIDGGSTNQPSFISLTASDGPFQSLANNFEDYFDTDSNLSISGWFKTTDTGFLFSNTEGAAATGLDMQVNASDMTLTLEDGSATRQLQASVDVNDGEWHHVVVTKTIGVTPVVKIYIDGEESASTTLATISDTHLRGANGFTLLGDGQENAGNSSPSVTDASKLQATLSNWSIHSEILSANAVKQVYSNGHVRNIKNLPSVTASSIVSWWQLNDASTPQDDLAGANDLAFLQVESANEKAAQTSTTITASTRDFVSTTASSLFGGTSLPAYNGAWSLSFWVNIPSNGTGSQFDTIIGEADSVETRKHFKIYQLNSALAFSMTFLSNALDLTVPFTTYNTWKHVTITKASGTPGTSTVAIYIDGVAQTVSVGYNDDNPSRGTADNWNTTNDSTITIGGQSWAYNSASSGAYAGVRSGRAFKVDSLAGYSKELSSSEVETIYNSGSYLDPSTLASSYNVESCFKFGDYSSDVTTGTIAIYDGVGGTGVLGIGTSNDQSIITLTSSDAIYAVSSITDLTTKLVNSDGATYVNGAINGNAMTMSLTKSFNFTTNKWVSTADQDTALCLSFNGFEEQAEYFALWKCSQTIAGSVIDICDGNWHNVILSYRGRNDLAGDNVSEGDTVKFGPGPADSLPFNWAVSYDGQPLTAINDGSGADYIGGNNTISTDTYNSVSYNVGFNIYNRHLRYETSNTEEEYKPHAQFSAGIHEVVGVNNNNAFQGYVDETSFHSDTWWVDQAGTSVTTLINAEKPATIYGSTTALDNRQGASTEYPEGKPYPLLNPEKLTTSGLAADIEGTNQYINPNRYNVSTNPNGGLEGWWRWGDTPGDCSITINDVKDHTDGINARDIDAFGIVTADRQVMTSADSIFLADSTASSGGGTTISFPQVKIEGIQQGICNLSNINSPLLQFVRVKIKGAGSMDLGEGKGQARLNYTNRRRRRKK